MLNLKKTTVALAAALLVPASSAFASIPPSDPPEPPVDTPWEARADLQISAPTVTATSGGWKVAYKIKNAGLVPTGSFAVDVNATTKSEAPLDPGASRTSSVTITRTSCYAAFRLVADPGNAVKEADEAHNTVWSVGQAAPVCADAPKYTVKAIDLHALHTQEAADEPYVVFSSVSEGDSTTWRTDAIPGVLEGEHVSLRPETSRCVWGTGASCAGRAATHGIGLDTQLFDHDSGDLSSVRAKVADAFKYAGPIAVLLGAEPWLVGAISIMDNAVDTVLAWLGDDHLGSATLAYSPADLAQRVPSVGDKSGETLILRDGERAAGAFYYLKLQIERVA